jgi:hypothetical protein
LISGHIEVEAYLQVFPVNELHTGTEFPSTIGHGSPVTGYLRKTGRGRKAQVLPDEILAVLFVNIKMSFKIAVESLKIESQVGLGIFFPPEIVELDALRHNHRHIDVLTIRAIPAEIAIACIGLISVYSIAEPDLDIIDKFVILHEFLR